MAVPKTYQPNFTGGELSPSLHARVDLTKYATGLKAAYNVILHPQGGASNRAGTEFVAQVKDDDISWQVPFVFDPETDQTYSLVFTDYKVRVIRAGSPVLETAIPVSGITNASPGVVTASAAHGFNPNDTVFLSVAAMTEITGRYFKVVYIDTTTFSLKDLFGNVIDTSAMAAFSGAAEVRRVYEIASPYASASLGRLVFTQENDVIYFAHQDYAPQKLSRLADDNWLFEAVTFAPSIAAPGTPTVTKPGDTSADPDYKKKRYAYKVSAISAAKGDESLPSASAFVDNDLTLAGGKNNVAWSAVTGTERYVIYRRDQGVFGYVGTTTSLNFDDENITPDLSVTPQQGVNLFTDTNSYPRCVTFFEQRLIYAATRKNPSAVFMSQTGYYENFGTSSPATARDSVVFRIRAREKNDIKAIFPLRGLGVFSSAAEWMVTGGQADYVTPSDLVIRPQSSRGASHVQPIQIDDTVIYPRVRGGAVVDYGYSFADDKFIGKDLTALARHLFRGRNVKSWAYANAPDSVVWVVMDDGALISLTYMKEHEVWGWTRHGTQGFFDCVVVIPEGNEDVPYFIVRREVQGVTKRYVERMRSRVIDAVEDSYFVDCGLTYDGAPANVFSGLHHLEGMEVVILADGNVIRGKTVINGAVTIDNNASVVHIGLGYTARIQTLPIDIGIINGLGTIQGRIKSIPKVTVSVENSRGLFAGVKEGFLNEWKMTGPEADGQPIPLFTGLFDIQLDSTWDQYGSVIIEQRDPLPMTVLAVAPELKVGS